MELSRIVGSARRWLGLLLLTVILGGAVGWGLASLQKPVYRATATLYVTATPSTQGEEYSALLASQILTRTYAQLAEKRPILLAAARTLSLPLDVEQMGKIVEVKVLRDTQLIEISAEYTDPDLARRISDTVAQLFIAETTTERAAQIAQARQAARQQREDVERQLASTLEAIALAQAQPNPNEVEINSLINGLSIYQSDRAQLQRSEAELALAETRAPQALKQVENAALPQAPVRPNAMAYLALGCLAGLLLATGTAFVLDSVDSTVKSESDVADSARLPTLGQTPVLASDGTTGPRVLNDHEVRSPLGEMYRVIWANAVSDQDASGAKVFVITSPNSGEGRTTTVANLATVLARGRQRVIAVDADLRKPSLHAFFNLENDAGLYNLLVDEMIRTESCLKATLLPNLRVLPAGPAPDFPLDIRRDGRLAAIIARLRAEADVVLLDSPPTLGVADTIVIGQNADAAIIVTEYGRTKSIDLSRSVEILARVCPRVLGVILGKVPRYPSGYLQNYRRGATLASSVTSPTSTAKKLDAETLNVGPMHYER